MNKMDYFAYKKDKMNKMNKMNKIDYSAYKIDKMNRKIHNY